MRVVMVRAFFYREIMKNDDDGAKDGAESSKQAEDVLNVTVHNATPFFNFS